MQGVGNLLIFWIFLNIDFYGARQYTRSKDFFKNKIAMEKNHFAKNLLLIKM